MNNCRTQLWNKATPCNLLHYIHHSILHMDCTVGIDGLLVIYGSVDGRTAQFWKYRSWSSCHTARLRHDCRVAHHTCGLHACVRELQHVFLRTCQSLGDTPYEDDRFSAALFSRFGLIPHRLRLILRVSLYRLTGPPGSHVPDSSCP